MKTKMIISNLKKIALTACAVVFLTSGIFAGSHNTDTTEEMNSKTRLDAFMNSAEMAARFIAPEADAKEEEIAARERLENMTSNMEAALKYEAPAAEEFDEIVPALERLDVLVAATEKAIRFEAPSNEDVQKVQFENNHAEIFMAEKQSY